MILGYSYLILSHLSKKCRVAKFHGIQKEFRIIKYKMFLNKKILKIDRDFFFVVMSHQRAPFGVGQKKFIRNGKEYYISNRQKEGRLTCRSQMVIAQWNSMSIVFQTLTVSSKWWRKHKIEIKYGESHILLSAGSV